MTRGTQADAWNRQATALSVNDERDRGVEPPAAEDVAPRFGLVPGRTREIPLPPPQVGTAPEVESFVYDVFGRLTAWDTAHPLDGPTSRSFAYDGSSRLVRVDKTSPTGTLTGVEYGYDVDDQVVEERHLRPPGVAFVQRHRGRQSDGQPGGGVVEPVLPMVRLVDGDLRVSLLEGDGHAMWTVDLTGPEDTFEVLGVYGMPVERFGPPSPWPVDGFHGIERSDAYDVAHFGARHMVLRDGLWMQPEPLLYLGLQQVDLGHPGAYGPLYAAGRTTDLTDPSGFTPYKPDAWTQFKMDVLKELGGGTTMGAAPSPQGVAIAVGAALTRPLVTRMGAAATALLAEVMTVSPTMLVEPASSASHAGGTLGTQVDADDPSIQVVEGPLPGMTGDQGAGSIYEVPGAGTQSGKPYIGRHDGPNPARDRTDNDGRDRTQADVIGGYDPAVPGAGAQAEQDAIDAAGGIENLDNKINAKR